MSGPLEAAYRRALRWYPKRWRDANEDAAIGTLLDKADDERRSAPARGELADLRASGLSTRFGAIDRLISPAVRDGVSIAALASGFALSAWSTVFSLTNTVGIDLHSRYFGTAGAHTFGPFTSFGIVLYGVWIVAFLAGLGGWPRVMRTMLLLTVPAAIIARVVSDWTGMSVYPTSTLVLLLAVFGMLALLGRPRPMARWRVSLAVAGLLAVGGIWLTLAQEHWLPSNDSDMFFERGFLYPEQALIGWICGVAPILVILCLAMSRWTWATVLTISLLPWLGLCVFGVGLHGSLGDVALLAALELAVAAAVTATVLHGRGFRIRITRT